MKKFFLLLFTVIIFSVSVSADTIILKDEQKFEADVQSFDSFYLNLKLSDERMVTIPWGEVRYIKHTTTASSWLEEEYMNNEDVKVKTKVTPLDPEVALHKALFPGFIVHGSGHFYAQDQNRGLSLMSLEIVSLVIMAISINAVISTDATDDVTKGVFVIGSTMFLGGWIYDLIFATSAVEKFNTENTFLLSHNPKTIKENDSPKKTEEIKEQK